MHIILMEMEKNEGSYRKFMAFGQREYVRTIGSDMSELYEMAAKMLIIKKGGK